MKKYIVFVMVLGLIAFVAPTGRAQAITLGDLQTQIKSLTSQVSSLASQLTGQVIVPTNTVNCSYSNKIGDANGSGGINAADATLIMKVVNHLIPTPAEIWCIDSDGNGQINNDDAFMASNYFVGSGPMGLVGQSKSVLPATCLSNTAPWLKVISPNGGEIYQAGQQINVTWGSCNVPADTHLNIRFTFDGAQGSLDPFISLNTWSQVYPLINSALINSNPGWNYGNHYKVSIRGTLPNSFVVADFSDNTFTIIDNTLLNTTPRPIVFPLINSTSVITSNQGDLNDSGTFTLTFNITGLNGDIYVPKTASNAVLNSILYNVNTANGDYEFGGLNGVVTCNNCPSTTANHFRIDDGTTRTMTLTVNVNNSQTTHGQNFYKMSLAGIPWNADDSNIMHMYIPSNIASYTTSNLYLN